MSPSYNVYQAGMPTIYSRGGVRQRGSGFFSALKRFVLPLAKRVLPHVANVVADISQGHSIKDTLKNRGIEAGADILETVGNQGANVMRNYSQPTGKRKASESKGKKLKQPPSKKYKKGKQSSIRSSSWK